MLIIDRNTSKSAIDWSNVESISLDESELPNRQLVVVTKSGAAFKVLNPTGEDGVAVDFDCVLTAWIERYTAWKVSEGDCISDHSTANIPPPLFDCGYCGEELEFGHCTNGHCLSKR
ncbi:hypothetical protein NVP1144O_60 [Vibrio phage 1.144.O._10N.286.45.B3]|nr:hypothetical protein NVP1144O_60 [Vibrio phage 1.144.O._10N.286.45.B3]